MNGENYLIDTNIFLEILLNQEKADECEKLLNNIKKSRHSFYISSFTSHSIEVIMTRNKQENALRDFLLFINKSKIIRIDSIVQDELDALKNMGEFNLDFDDSIQLTLCMKYNLSIISYDKHFDKTLVKRIEPHNMFNIE